MNQHPPVAPPAPAPASPATSAALRDEDAFRALARLERLGVLDLALLALTAAQWFLFARDTYPASLTFERLVAQRLHFAQPMLVLATWAVLAAGALAPLARRAAGHPAPSSGVRPSGGPSGASARRSSQLPPGGGLVLTAYALMTLLWFVVYFNSFVDGLWGFWHLARLGANEAIPFAVLLPLVLAPGWRRLARALRLARLRRQRQSSLPHSNNPQSAIRNLLVPHSAFRIPHSPRSAFRIPHSAFFFFSAAVLAWLFVDRAIMSDGFGIIGFAQSSQVLGPLGYREPGTMLLLQAAVHLLRPLGLDAAAAIRLTNFLATLGTLAVAGGLMRRLELGRRQRRAGWLLLLSSLGVTQMLFGHVELYPLVNLALTATVAAAIGVAAFGDCPAKMVIIYALGLAGHLALIFALPAVLVALACWTRPLEPAARPHTPLRAAAHLFGWGALIHLPLWGLLMSWLERPTPRGLVLAVLGSLNTGAKTVTEARYYPPTLARRLAALVHPVNDFKLVQILFYLAGGALLVALLIGAARLGRAWRPCGAPDPRWRRQMAVLAAAFLGYLLYAFAWHNDWSWTEDWDLFSGIAPLAVLLVLRALLPARGAWALPPRLVTQLCLFALALGATQHYFYHRYATYLNTFGQVQLNPRDGLLIQQYQLRHGWKRYYSYNVENGQVVVRKISGAPEEPPAATRPGKK